MVARVPTLAVGRAPRARAIRALSPYNKVTVTRAGLVPTPA